jgi:hypothetical protein
MNYENEKKSHNFYWKLNLKSKMSLDSESLRLQEALKLPEVTKISVLAEKVALLHTKFNFSKSILCSGKSKIISHQVFNRALKSYKLGFQKGKHGRRPKLNIAQEKKLETEIKKRRLMKERVTCAFIRKMV